MKIGGKEICPDNKSALYSKKYMAYDHKTYNKMLYNSRKNNNLCPVCGKPLDRVGHYCSECLVKHRERKRRDREFYRENKLCAECGKYYVYGSEVYCEECKAKRYVYSTSHIRTDEEKKKFREQQNSLYRELSENGICTRCGKRKAAPDRKKCKLCLRKDSEAHRIKYGDAGKREYKLKNHLCLYCGEPLGDIKTSKLCLSCQKKCSERLQKAKEEHPERFNKNTGWKLDNKLIFKN